MRDISILCASYTLVGQLAPVLLSHILIDTTLKWGVGGIIGGHKYRLYHLVY